MVRTSEIVMKVQALEGAIMLKRLSTVQENGQQSCGRTDGEDQNNLLNAKKEQPSREQMNKPARRLECQG